MEQQLSRLAPAVAPVQRPAAGPLEAAPPVACSTEIPPGTDVSYPDSGFQLSATGESFLSSGTADSLKTVRTLSPVQSAAEADSADCSLLEQYLSSIQRREEEEVSDGTETPQPSSPLPSPGSPPQSPGDQRSDPEAAL